MSFTPLRSSPQLNTSIRETRAVNAWFANKRSASKKRSRAHVAPYGSPEPVNDEDEEWNQHYSWSSPPPGAELNQCQTHTAFPTTVSEHQHIFEEDSNTGIPRRMRMRPSTWQTEELRKLYNHNSHPSREEREELGNRIGMQVNLLIHMIMMFIMCITGVIKA